MATPLRTPHERAPVPALGHELIPKERYTSPEYAAREWQRMWTRVWLCAGRESDAPRPGDYVSFEIGPESILVVRQRDGRLAARYNVCTHRGTRLREPGRGHAERFACPFHGWQFDLDGRLVAPLDPESFAQGCAGLDLRAVRCESWAGFVFVNLDPAAQPLREYLGVIPAHLDPYHFEEWQIAFDARIEIDCNWKTSVDAFNEAYHLAATHTWTLEFSDDVRTQYDCYEKHTRMIFPELQASPRHAGAGTVTPGIRDLFLRRVGVDLESFRGGPAEARAAFAEAIRKMGPALGCDFSELSESQMCDDFHYTLFPNLTLNIHSLFTWVFTHRPHPDDPNKMFFDFVSLVRAPAQKIPRPETLQLSAARGDRLAGRCEGGELMDEDLYNLPRIQAGMRSASFRGLHLGSQEIRIRHFHKTLEEYVASPKGRAASASRPARSEAQPSEDRTGLPSEDRTDPVSARVFVDVSDFAPGGLRALKVAGLDVVVCHAEGAYYALENRCPHAFAPLDAGRLEGCVLECPLHGGRLDVRDGSPRALPIRKSATTFAVRPVPGGIEIDCTRAAGPRREACTT